MKRQRGVRKYKKKLERGSREKCVVRYEVNAIERKWTVPSVIKTKTKQNKKNKEQKTKRKTKKQKTEIEATQRGKEDGKSN